jgi:hypothetical protein
MHSEEMVFYIFLKRRRCIFDYFTYKHDIVRGLVFRNNNILVGHRCRGRYLTTVVYLCQRSIKYIGHTENDIESNKSKFGDVGD